MWPSDARLHVGGSGVNTTQNKKGPNDPFLFLVNRDVHVIDDHSKASILSSAM